MDYYSRTLEALFLNIQNQHITVNIWNVLWELGRSYRPLDSYKAFKVLKSYFCFLRKTRTFREARKLYAASPTLIIPSKRDQSTVLAMFG